MADPIRIRISALEERKSNEDPRSTFWATYRQQNESNESIPQLEQKLCRGLGRALTEKVVEFFKTQVNVSESELAPGDFRDFERFFFRFGGPEERNFRSYQIADSYAKYLDYRLEILKSNPILLEARSRIPQAASICFSVQVAHYGSLDLDVFVAPLERVANLFDNNFDSFRVFLEVFIPEAVGEVLTEEFANQNSFSVSASRSFEDEFIKAAKKSAPAATRVRDSTVPVPPAIPAASSDRERAVWLWRLANGSLLVPVLVALLTVYFGLKEISSIQESQSQMLAPVLQYQLEILKEDRLRIPGLRDSGEKDGAGASPGQSRSDKIQ